MAASNDNTITLISDGAAVIPQYSMVSTDAAGDIGLPPNVATRTVGIVQEGIALAAAAGQPTAVQVLGVSLAIVGTGGFGAGGATIPLMVDPVIRGTLIAHNGAAGSLHCANWIPTRTQAVAGAAVGSLIRVLIVPCPVAT